MPKIVDHDERRREAILAAWSVIAREGLARTTMKKFALELGTSVGVLVHYFADKRDLLVNALRGAHDEVRRMYSEQDPNGQLRGLTALREFMLFCLPLDEHRKKLAAVELAFWAESVGDDQLMQINAEEGKNFQDRLSAFLMEAIELKELSPNLDFDVAVTECRLLMDGLSMQSVVSPRLPSKDMQEKMLDELLKRLRQRI